MTAGASGPDAGKEQPGSQSNGQPGSADNDQFGAGMTIPELAAWPRPKPAFHRSEISAAG